MKNFKKGQRVFWQSSGDRWLNAFGTIVKNEGNGLYSVKWDGNFTEYGVKAEELRKVY